MKRLWIFMLFLIALVACDSGSEVAPNVDLFPNQLDLGGFTVDSLDNDNHAIYVTPEGENQDSLTINSVADLLAASNGTKVFLANTTDMEDPDIVNWDAPLQDGSRISVKDASSIAIVILDDKNRVVAVWEIKMPVVEEASSSSQELKVSSETASSSSVLPAVSSSSKEDISSSSYESSSSENLTQNIALGDFKVGVENSTISIENSKIYVEVPYGTDLTAIKVLPMNTVADLTRPVEMEFVDASGALQTYSVVAGMQLPGSDFNARVDSIWATTSDAMGTVSDDIYKIGMFVDKVESKKNMFLSNGKLTVSSELVNASFIGIVGGKKLAGGFYYTGTYPKSNSAVHIYERGYTSGTPGTDASDISLDMTFGKKFAARPASFHVKYDYVHKKNENDTQMGLIYVVLLAEDNKTIVASGAVKMTADESKEKEIDLVYDGSDSGLISSGYVGTGDLAHGDGTNEVAYIRVMFASSARAHVVVSGESDYLGGEGSSLTIEQFRLNY
ncbi:MAG: PCMD domain-containing protein [Fibrobacter sp.]|nr:PCMD domain-containing protein [Fibrobacter sp.]